MRERQILLKDQCRLESINFWWISFMDLVLMLPSTEKENPQRYCLTHYFLWNLELFCLFSCEIKEWMINVFIAIFLSLFIYCTKRTNKNVDAEVDARMYVTHSFSLSLKLDFYYHKQDYFHDHEHKISTYSHSTVWWFYGSFFLSPPKTAVWN